MKMSKLEQWWRRVKNRVGLRNTTVEVAHWQEGNKMHLQLRTCGLLRQYRGVPFVATLQIDPSLVISDGCSGSNDS